MWSSALCLSPLDPCDKECLRQWISLSLSLSLSLSFEPLKSRQTAETNWHNINEGVEKRTGPRLPCQRKGKTIQATLVTALSFLFRKTVLNGGPRDQLSLSQREKKTSNMYSTILISIYQAYRQWSKRSFSDLWTWATQRKAQSRTNHFSQPIALIHLDSLLRRAYTPPLWLLLPLTTSNASWVQWGSALDTKSFAGLLLCNTVLRALELCMLIGHHSG